MKIIVLKFGGTSVGTLDRIIKISKIIISYIKKNYKVIVVTSAMSGVTNELIKKAGKISKNFPFLAFFLFLGTGIKILFDKYFPVILFLLFMSNI